MTVPAPNVEDSTFSGVDLVVSRVSPEAGGTEEASARHGHLWRLADGTGLHAPYGIVTRHPETGEACCHLCGRWFRALGSHVRVHGYRAPEYREALGLTRTRPLTAPELSAALSRRAVDRYWSSPTLQASFAPGHDLARKGALPGRREDRRPEAAGLQLRAVQAGRRTTEGHRRRAREELLEQAGADDLGAYLRETYEAGASLDLLGRQNRLGRAQLRQAVIDAGIVIRPGGANTTDGKRSRAFAADGEAARRVGAADIRTWLRTRRSMGPPSPSSRVQSDAAPLGFAGGLMSSAPARSSSPLTDQYASRSQLDLAKPHRPGEPRLDLPAP